MSSCTYTPLFAFIAWTGLYIIIIIIIISEMGRAFITYGRQVGCIQGFGGGRTEGKRPLGIPRRRWEDNIKTGLREMGGGDLEWIDLAQDRERWRAVVNAVMLNIINNYILYKYIYKFLYNIYIII